MEKRYDRAYFAVRRYGKRRIQRLLNGVAFVEAYTSEDDMVGDMDDWHLRPPSYYRRTFREAGFTACGLHCYAGRASRDALLAMETTS